MIIASLLSDHSRRTILLTSFAFGMNVIVFGNWELAVWNCWGVLEVKNT